MPDYLRPFDQGFFRRGLALQDSLVAHLRYVLQTARGSVAADPDYGCEVELGRLGLQVERDKLMKMFVEAIEQSDRRVGRALAQVEDEAEHQLVIAITLEMHRSFGVDPVVFRVNVNTHAGRLELEGGNP